MEGRNGCGSDEVFIRLTWELDESLKLAAEHGIQQGGRRFKS
jgi:hypothetical protein